MEVQLASWKREPLYGSPGGHVGAYGGDLLGLDGAPPPYPRSGDRQWQPLACSPGPEYGTVW